MGVTLELRENLQMMWNMKKCWNIRGTIAEDVITGGGGIADDAASFYLAYRLMFGL